MQEICVRMKILRKEMMLTQVEFSNRLGVTNAHISKIEKGKTVPSEALIKLICKEFGVSNAWLKEGRGPMELEELDTQIEEKLMRSVNDLNKLIMYNRELGACIQEHIAKIVNIENMAEKEKVIYLGMVETLFRHLSYLLGKINSGGFYQLTLTTQIDIELFDMNKEAIIDDINGFREYYIKLIS